MENSFLNQDQNSINLHCLASYTRSITGHDMVRYSKGSELKPTSDFQSPKEETA